jgi:PTS system fructose-specific IIA component/PTS system nitrogen regulatory IIA component
MSHSPGIWDGAVFCHDLRAAGKEDAVRQMARAVLRDQGFHPGEVEEVAQAVLRRETLGSTGIGRRVAIPHTKWDLVARLRVGWFFAPTPIPFDSLDGEPVVLLVCLISPRERPGDHLRMLESISRTIRGLPIQELIDTPPESEAAWKEWVGQPR